MFLRDKKSGGLIRVEDIEMLFSPACSQVMGCHQAGQEEQDPAWYAKAELEFPSGEPLPQCWTDPAYRTAALAQ